MAQASDSKQQNQAFLQNMERQRLNKICNRAIDLRGRVSGECQAYQFGDKVHYLDDRAYLIAKQLLARTEGRYTVGVYETLLKAVKQLKDNQAAAEQNDAAVADDNIIQIEQQISRRENRVLLTTAVIVKKEDLLYNGHTIDVAETAMRVTLRRTHTLAAGDSVTVELVEQFAKEGQSFLQEIPFNIIKIFHTDTTTTLIMVRQRGQDTQLDNWLHDWVEKHAERKPKEIDDDIQNQLKETCLQLWMQQFSSPIFWTTEAPIQIVASHVSRISSHLVECWEQRSAGLFLRTIPAIDFTDDQRYLLLLGQDKAWSTPLSDQTGCRNLINYQQQHDQQSLFLLQNISLSNTPEIHQQALTALVELDEKEGEAFKTSLSRTTGRMFVHNISALATHLSSEQAITEKELEALQIDTASRAVPSPKMLKTDISRETERFYIRTPITLHVDDNEYELQTLDFSADGLSILIPDYIQLNINQRVTIDFVRWQAQTQKVNLKQIPYQVKNKYFWAGEIRLGLARIRNNCPAVLTQFFTQMISNNQQSLRQNINDQIEAIESSIYADLLRTTLTSIPIYIGLNQEGKRSLQMIASTAQNQVMQLQGLWQAMEAEVATLSEWIKSHTSEKQPAFSTLIYAFSDNNTSWRIVYEHQLTDTSQKTMFIQRMMTAKSYRCFYAEFTRFHPEQLQDFAERFMVWHAQRANRIKTIRQSLTQLMGMVELTDISATLEALFSKP